MRVAASILLSATLAACGGGPRPLRLATTTSIDQSGLLGALLPPFTATTGIRVDVLTVGTGRALVLLERGDADAAITHDPEAERAFSDRHRDARLTPLMRNDFVVVGPAGDPAGAATAASASEAFARMAGAGARFVSRGDRSEGPTLPFGGD
jgi:tungstate transport system substrate-binding protein